MISIVSAIIVLGVLIFVHELGHFTFAKLFKVGVEKFSLGFGPKLVGKKIGETEYLISAFPLGGYVKMVGEGSGDEVSEVDLSRSFNGKPAWQRIIIIAAGPLFNLVFAYFVYISVFMIGVPVTTAKIGEVVPGKPAAQAGLKTGDMVLSINKNPVAKWGDLSRLIVESGGKPLDIEAKRDGRTLLFHIVPEVTRQKNLLGETTNYPMIGVAPSGDYYIKRYSPVASVVKGSEQALTVVKLTYVVLWKIATRSIPLNTIGGPIMIAKMAGEQAEAGLASLLFFMALLSVNLGVLNLLPIPILDGGHLMFYTWECIFRKPVSMKAREIGQQIGLVLLVGLMFLAFYNDIIRYFVGKG